MAGTPDPTTPGARFPYASAAFACACVAAAVWTFMLYSYAWSLDWDDLQADGDPLKHPLIGRYVIFPAREDGKMWRSYSPPIDNQTGEDIGGRPYVAVRGVPGAVRAYEALRGRVVVEWTQTSVRYPCLAIDVHASRWTGASVAGLVVGAMGAFIFALHLRRWLRVRRLAAGTGTAFTTEDAEGVEEGKGWLRRGGDTLRGSQNG